jgi:hypothetical protein
VWWPGGCPQTVLEFELRVKIKYRFAGKKLRKSIPHGSHFGSAMAISRYDKVEKTLRSIFGYIRGKVEPI